MVVTEYLEQTMPKKFTIFMPDQFNYQMTLFSHGWYLLAPFRYDAETNTLYRVHQLGDGCVIQIAIKSAENDIVIEVDGVESISPDQQNEIIDCIKRIFNFDWDLSAFYEAMSAYDNYRWIAQKQAGRMFIAPTVWEDLVKTLLTTNTTWSQTIAMTARFCELGQTSQDKRSAFPPPAEIVAIPFEEFHEQVRAGYRSQYLYELATNLVEGTLQIENWYQDNITSQELYKAVKSLKGFGDYSAGTMLRLLGKFDRLAIDTACRSAYKRVTDSETATDKEIHAYYRQFEEWQGLVAWMDVMKRHYVDE